MTEEFENYSLKKWNTFHLDAKARYFVEYDSWDIVGLIRRYNHMPILHIGRGSNLLFVNDFDGAVFHSKYNRIVVKEETDDSVLLQVGSGVIFDDLVSLAVARSWYGIENLSYIPGEVGASAVQNIGAYGVEVKDVIEQVRTINIETTEYRSFSNLECNYGYRDSIFKNELKNQYIVLDVYIRLSKKTRLQLDYGNVRQSLQGIVNPTLADVRKTIINIRKQKLPEVDELGSAGSFFKNPVISVEQFNQLREQYPDMPYFEVYEGMKIPAAWLISQAGMKGKKEGGAQVYEKQPLVIVNADNATANDIVALAAKVQVAVNDKFGISIVPEVNYIS